MLNRLDLVDKGEQERQVASESFKVQRERFRRDNHRRVREWENLPAIEMVNGRSLYRLDGQSANSNPRDGESVGYSGVITGTRTLPGAGFEIAEGIIAAADFAEEGFQLHCLNPIELTKELIDLDRDATRMERAEGVSFENLKSGLQMDSSILLSDEGLLAWTAAAVAEMERLG